MLFTVKFLLINEEIEKAAKIAAFYDFSVEDLNFLVGEERAKELEDFIKKHNLHRVDESVDVFDAFTIEKKEEKKEKKEKKKSKEKEEKDEEKSKKKGKKRKKSKDLTLDFFS